MSQQLMEAVQSATWPGQDANASRMLDFGQLAEVEIGEVEINWPKSNRWCLLCFFFLSFCFFSFVLSLFLFLLISLFNLFLFSSPQI